MAFSPDRSTICIGGTDGVVRLWRLGTGELVQALGQAAPDSLLSGIAFSPDGNRIVWSAEDGIVRVWDVKKGGEVGRFSGQKGIVLELAFSRSSRLLASAGNDGTILVWDLSQIP